MVSQNGDGGWPHRAWDPMKAGVLSVTSWRLCLSIFCLLSEMGESGDQPSNSFGPLVK